ncbi:MAG: recombinase family protein [Cellvibrio sp.]|nr:recombinase family protein [Cellvibrio sp.]
MSHSATKSLVLISYRATVQILNSEEYKTSRGNKWTTRRLFRMLQRNHISGLHGLGKLAKKGYFQTPLENQNPPTIKRAGSFITH